MSDRDRGYKQIFSSPQMMKDLLVGFIHEDWVREIDLDSFERQDGSFVSEDLRARENDILWRVKMPRRGEDSAAFFYVYVLCEFQSTVDRFMAARILTYLGLLYDDLRRRKELVDKRFLPPVVPIVLYAGERRWTAPTNVADLVLDVPGELRRYRPALTYLLLDETRLVAADPPHTANLAALLFALERATDERAILGLGKVLWKLLCTPGHEELRRAFSQLMELALRKNLGPDTDVPSLMEEPTMLETNLRRIRDRWRQDGRDEGLAKGLAEGQAKGLAEGQLVGRAEGQTLVLTRQLERRFGPLDEETLARLSRATPEQLLVYAERLLDAPSLTAVFTD